MAEVKIEGLAELRRALTRIIPAEMQGKVLQKALTAGTKLTVDAARSKAPVKTGRLRRAIYATRDKKHSQPTYEARVVSVRRGKREQKNNRDAYYWKFVEFGHRIATGKTGYLRKQGRSSGGFAGEAGMVPPKPFMRPAFETTKERSLGAITAKLKSLLDEAARKARF
jgi:HK97 gp10 family phage protein